jgi:hypothetical protein
MEDHDKGTPQSAPIPIVSVTGEDLVLAAKEGYTFKLSDDNRSLVLWSKDDWGLILRTAPEAMRTHHMNCIVQCLRLIPRQFYEIKLAKEGQIVNRYEQMDKLYVSTRSTLETMYYLSQGISIPPDHIEQGLVTITLDANGEPFDWTRVTGDLLRVHSSKTCPKRAAVAVLYRGFWFYVDDRDLNSKSTFRLLLGLYSLQVQAAGGQAVPVLTLGVGG